MLISIDDLELTGDDKIKADLQFKELLANIEKENDAKKKQDLERTSRELSEISLRHYHQQQQYKEMMIDVQVEAIQRIEAEKFNKTKPVTAKPTKKPINEQRDDDFTQWINELKPDLDLSGLTKNNLLKAPTRKNEWFEVINEMVNEFHAKNGLIPTATQVWNLLCTQPPQGYAVTTGKNKKGVVTCLMMAGCKSLNRSAFDKRWANYTK